MSPIVTIDWSCLGNIDPQGQEFLAQLAQKAGPAQTSKNINVTFSQEIPDDSLIQLHTSRRSASCLPRRDFATIQLQD